MRLIEKKGDLFKITNADAYAHCISGDYALGAGIAKQFDQRYNMRSALKKEYPIPFSWDYANVGKALYVNGVYNLVTKPRYWMKPTYSVFEKALVDMKKDCVNRGIQTIAMPKIGCGLDRLNWDIVRDLIKEVFADTEITIIVAEL